MHPKNRPAVVNPFRISDSIISRSQSGESVSGIMGAKVDVIDKTSVGKKVDYFVLNKTFPLVYGGQVSDPSPW